MHNRASVPAGADTRNLTMTVALGWDGAVANGKPAWKHSCVGATGRSTLYGAHYVIQADKSFRTRLVRMHYVGGPTLHVITDGKGNWQDVISGGSIAELEGCLDVDIGVTPSTNTLPIRRLMLEQGSSADIRIAYVPLPDQIEKPFLPRPAAQRYTCITAGHLYRYDGLFRNFSADLEVDRNGLVIDYPKTFRRLSLQ
jgi:hypothetical protein